MNTVAILAFVFYFTLCTCQTIDIGVSTDPDVLRNVSSLISSKGYPAEEHTVQTADGYILCLQRIPDGRSGILNGTKKPVVFLLHGLLSSAADWVMNFPHQSLGFILADAGYDVWLGNSRGNTYSNRHVMYSIKDVKFWDYSFDEMAEYDLPAMIDYVLEVTGEKDLYYIGHSQGTAIAFALLSENPEYNEKIKLFIALAPVAILTNAKAFRYLVPFTSDIQLITKLMGVKQFFPSNRVTKFFSHVMCDTEAKFLCENLVLMIYGVSKSQLNQTRLSVYSSHTPAGSSVRSVAHYAQLMKSKTFAKYDYGGKGNIKHYNQETPPEYDVSRITTPVALIWASNDNICSPIDVKNLQKNLNTMVSSYNVPQPDFSHVDFVYGIDANRLVYDHVLFLLSNY